MTTRCQFPIGDPRAPDFRVCGQPVERPGSPYCPTCRAIAHRKEKRAPRLRHSQRAATGGTSSEMDE